MVTKGLINSLMICENIYLLCWTVPKKIMVLLAFSYFPTYSDLVLLPGFPLPSTASTAATFAFSPLEKTTNMEP